MKADRETENIQPADKEKFDLYLMIGQSNMSSRAHIEMDDTGKVDRTYLLNENDKWEPAAFDVLPAEINKGVQGYNRYSSIEYGSAYNGYSSGYTFALSLVNEIPDISIGIINNSAGGSSLAQWKKGTTFFEESVRRAKKAMETGTLKGIIWHQGGSDINNENYMKELKKFAQDLRDALGAGDVPFVASELLPTEKYEPFNKRIVTIKEFVPNSDYISSEGTTDIGDDTHTNREGQRILGVRFAEKILEAAYNKKVKLQVPEETKPIIFEETRVVEKALDNEKPFVVPDGIKLWFEDNYIIFDTPLIMYNDRVLVPLRGFFEALNLTVEWNEAEQMITIFNDVATVVCKINDVRATINGDLITLDTPPMIKDGNTMISVRFIAESMNRRVEWDEVSETVVIYPLIL